MPTGVYFVSVRAAGAGGGGGGSDLNGAGGGGGNGAAITITLRVTPGQTLSGVVGGGGSTAFTGGYVTACAGGGAASTFGGAGAGANSNCASGGYSGGGGGGGGGSSVALTGTIVAQAGGGGGGSGGGWNNLGTNGISAVTTITQTASCSALGTGTPGTILNLDGGAAGGGGGGFPGGASGAGSGDDSGSTGTVGATGGGTKSGGGGGGSCYNTTAAILAAVTSGIGGVGAAGNATVGGTSPGLTGGAGSITVTLLPSVIVAKTSTGGVGTFGFSGTNGLPAQSLTTITGGTSVSGLPQLLQSPAAQTVITEDASPGFALTAISCSNMGSGGTATVNPATRSITMNAAAISPGVAVICTFTNSAALTISKTSIVVWDPVSGIVNPKAIPGAEVRYCIRVTNAVSGPVAAVPVVTDTLPANVTYVPNSLFINGTVNVSGTCNTGAFVNGTKTTAPTGSGASGTVGGSFGVGVVSGNLATINSGTTTTLYFDVIID